MYNYARINNYDVIIVWCYILQSVKQIDTIGKEMSHIYHDHCVYYV